MNTNSKTIAVPQRTLESVLDNDKGVQDNNFIKLQSVP